MGQATRKLVDEGGGLVRLRPASIEDRKLIYRALARSDVTDLLLGHDAGRQTRVLSYAAFCDDYTEQYFDDSNAEGGRCFVIEVDGRACGQVNYNEIDRIRSRAELDIWMFGERFCGLGYGTEALRLLWEHLRSNLGVEGFFLKPSGRNPRALRAYEKAGFTRVALSPAEAEREYGPPDEPDTVYMEIRPKRAGNMPDVTARRRNAAVAHLCAELVSDPGVSGVFLFGSHARGEARPDSDIDLLVVRAGPFEKQVIQRGGVEFELFMNNEPEIVEFWKANEDDFTSFWADARVLFDRGGATTRLAAAATQIRKRP